MIPFTKKKKDFNNVILDKARISSDVITDVLIAEIFKTAQPHEILKEISNITYNHEKIPAHLPAFVHEYFAVVSVMPDWASNHKINLATTFFEQHSESYMLCLLMLSLPYCYAAGEDAEVLRMSARINQDTKKRLAETGQFVVDVLSANAFSKVGKAIRSIQKVRIMHAVVRYYISRNTSDNGFNGIPINQEAMCGTNLAFSYIIILGLRKLYIDVSLQENAILHTWSVIGFMLGIEPDYLVFNIKSAQELESLIRKRHFKKTTAGIELSATLIKTAIEFFPDQKPDQYLYPLMRYLLGEPIAELLEVPRGNKNANIIDILKMKNTVENVFNFNKSSMLKQTKNQILIQTGGKPTNFTSEAIKIKT